jgi:hypothetical protein
LPDISPGALLFFLLLLPFLAIRKFANPRGGEWGEGGRRRRGPGERSELALKI